MIRRPRGTRDLLPDEADRLLEVQRLASELFGRYGYRPIVTPLFEQTELFVRGIGEATDIVEKEMYTFKDRRGRSLTLRPEGTAPVVRAFLENGLGRDGLVKLRYSSSMYRYERPQAGRYREFWQVGAEAIGSPSAAVDAELILLVNDYLEELGVIEMDHLISSMGCRECRPGYVQLLREYARPLGDQFCDDCAKRLKSNPLRVFDCQKESCKQLLTQAPSILENLCANCKAHFDEVRQFLNDAGLEFTVSATLVRGLDYYTRTTFEVRSPQLGAQNALGGGGRYDYLVEEYGGKPTPAAGFAVGVDRILLALGGAIPGKVSRPPETFFLVALGREARRRAATIVLELRRAGVEAHTTYEERSLKSQLRRADRMAAKFTGILGDAELGNQQITLKDMRTGEQAVIPLADTASAIAERFGRGK